MFSNSNGIDNNNSVVIMAPNNSNFVCVCANGPQRCNGVNDKCPGQ